VSGLTDADRAAIARARDVAALEGDALLALAGTADTGLAYARAFGKAQYWLTELADLAERLAAAGPPRDITDDEWDLAAPARRQEDSP
jgi:hypothetical protein